MFEHMRKSPTNDRKKTSPTWNNMLSKTDLKKNETCYRNLDETCSKNDPLFDQKVPLEGATPHPPPLTRSLWPSKTGRPQKDATERPNGAKVAPKWHQNISKLARNEFKMESKLFQKAPRTQALNTTQTCRTDPKFFHHGLKVTPTFFQHACKTFPKCYASHKTYCVGRRHEA